LENGFLEAFLRPNVEVVSVKDNPIERVTPSGLQLRDGAEYAFDTLIFATGFDAGTAVPNARTHQHRTQFLVEMARAHPADREGRGRCGFAKRGRPVVFGKCATSTALPKDPRGQRTFRTKLFAA
jgi:hypothetical protein